jgi:hypothetical protein
MAIVESKQKTGILTLGGTATQAGTPPVWTVTGGTSFACQATNVRVTPNYEDDGDALEVLCGDSLGVGKKESWVLAGTSIQDFDNPEGFLAYCFDERLTDVGFTWQANTTAPLWAGMLTVIALEEGGDVNTRLTTDWEFAIIGTPSRGLATGIPPAARTATAKAEPEREPVPA